MELDKEVKDNLELMAKNEEAVGKLYKAYAKNFPEDRIFWIQIAMDEDKHAYLIRSFAGLAEKSPTTVDHERFTKEAILAFTKFLDEEIARLQKEQITPMTALSVAFHIEKSLIESQCFEVFQTESIEMKKMLKTLKDETQRHLKKVDNRWNEERLK